MSLVAGPTTILCIFVVAQETRRPLADSSPITFSTSVNSDLSADRKKVVSVAKICNPSIAH